MSNLALEYLNPPGYSAVDHDGTPVVRVATNTIVGDGAFGELRYVRHDADGEPWEVDALRDAVVDALLLGDGFIVPRESRRVDPERVTVHRTPRGGDSA